MNEINVESPQPVTAGDAEPKGQGSAWAVSIEVDGRQAYLFETDKLQEVVGASAIMRRLADKATELELETD